MSSLERDIVLLKEVLDLIDLTMEHVPPDIEQFFADVNARDATALRLQAIGEHMRSLSNDFREQHPELPWLQAIAMRNVIAHEYGNLDFTIVWNVVTGPEFNQFRRHVVEILEPSVR